MITYRRHFADRGTVALLGVLALWGLVPIALMMIHALQAHLRLTGADGIVGGDQLQYLAWARDAGRHGLASNLFDLQPSGHVFAQPLFSLSGALWRLGLPLTAAYWLWKPIAILILVAGTAAWAARLLADSLRARLAAVALALFFYTPAAALAAWAELGSAGSRTGLLTLAGETFPAGELWGYLPSAITVGLMPLVLLGTERALNRGGTASALVAAAGAALVSWLHPWQGVVLLLILAGLTAWGRGRGWRKLGVVGLGAALPLVYYFVLSRSDPAWKLAAHNELVPHLPAGALLLGLGPPLALAGLGVRRPGADPAERALLLWIPAALITYLFVNSFPSHALESLSLPLAVLMVRGWRRARWPGLAGVAALAAVTLPGMAYEARSLHDVATSPIQQYYLSRSDARALDWVARQDPRAGVMARTIFGVGLPSQTGRAVWVGHEFWSRDYPVRMRAADSLFSGALKPPVARAFVLLSGVRLVFSDCGAGQNLRATLAPVSAAIHRFGCATVFVVKRGPRSV